MRNRRMSLTLANGFSAITTLSRSDLGQMGFISTAAKYISSQLGARSRISYFIAVDLLCDEAGRRQIYTREEIWSDGEKRISI